MAHRSKSSGFPRRRLVMALLLLLSLLLRLGSLDAPFVFPDDWSLSLFLLQARNFVDYGAFTAYTIPYFGIVADQPMVYANHPWLAPWILCFWGLPFDYSELAYRSLAIVFSLASVAAIYRLGEQADGEETGIVAALFFSVAPLSIHTGRGYGFELVHICFLLWALFFLIEWQKGLASWKPCGIFLCLAQLSDMFGLFFSSWLLVVGLWCWSRGAAWKGYIGLASIPIVTQAVLTAITMSRALGQDTWKRSVARGGHPWDDWMTLAYWSDTATKAAWNYGYVVPLLALFGAILWVRRPLENPDSRMILGFLWYFPLLYALLGSYWLKRHNHLIMFFGPILALQAAYVLRGQRRPVKALLLLAQLGLSLWIYLSNFHQKMPYHYAEIRSALALREELRKGDVLVGLPPHIIYYARCRDVIPWNYFLTAGLRSEEDAFDLLRPLVEGYQRVLIYPQYIEYSENFEPPNFSRLFSKESGFVLEPDRPDGAVVWTKQRSPGAGARETERQPADLPKG